MQKRVNGSPIVHCPGCNQPMVPKERKPAPKNTRLVDVRYICPTCEMETTRTVSE
jgi:transposase-like protein